MPDLVEVPVGQPTELEVTVTIDGSPIDPSAGQAFTVREPDGTVVNLGAGTNQGGGSGIVKVVYDSPILEGDHWWSFSCDTPKTWQQHLFVAVQDRVAGTGLADTALTTVAHARVYIKRKLNATIDPELADLLINSYSEAVMDYTDRQFRPLETDVEHFYGYDGSGYLSLNPADLRDATQITLAAGAGTPSVLTSSEYVLEPRSRSSEGTYLSLILPKLDRAAAGYIVAVTGDWGCEQVPGAVELATLIAVADGYRNPEGGASRSVGELEYTEIAEPAGVRGRALPSDARALLDPFCRVGI